MLEELKMGYFVIFKLKLWPEIVALVNLDFIRFYAANPHFGYENKKLICRFMQMRFHLNMTMCSLLGTGCSIH